MKCRHCGALLEQTFVDLGYAPPSNAYLSKEDLSRPETYFPLRVKVCDHCWLVQTEDYAGAEDLFTKDYAYFSSTSTTWLAHARTYSTMIIDRLSLSSKSLVIEVASNDGYLLRNFVDAEIPCLGIEPTASTAAAAEDQGIPVLKEFFTEPFAQSVVSHYGKADLVVANNVYAHVPDINDFTRGIAALLKPEGVVTLEFPHVLNLIEQCQFDTIYHEHFSYLALASVQRIFATWGLRIWDVERLETHGGSLRVYGCLSSAAIPESSSVTKILEQEESFGLSTLDPYLEFQSAVNRRAITVIDFLQQMSASGSRVVGYGAAAKASTLLNYCGIKPWLLPLVCDASQSKQGKFLPGSHIPVVSPAELVKQDFEALIIFPWNIADEVKQWLKSAISRDVQLFTFKNTVERL